MNCFNENELISWVNNLVAFCKVLFVEDFALGRFRRREIRVDPEDQLEFHRDKAKRELVDRRVAPILNLRWIRRIDVRVEVSDRRTTIFDEKKKRKNVENVWNENQTSSLLLHVVRHRMMLMRKSDGRLSVGRRRRSTWRCFIFFTNLTLKRSTAQVWLNADFFTSLKSESFSLKNKTFLPHENKQRWSIKALWRSISLCLCQGNFLSVSFSP